MSDEIEFKDLNTLMKTIDLVKKIVAEVISRGSTKEARSFLDTNNKKRAKFKRKTCEIRHKSIHEQIEKSINKLREHKKNLSITEKEDLHTKNIILKECFKPFSPSETYRATYKKKKQQTNINSLFFEDSTYREEFKVEHKYISPVIAPYFQELQEKKNIILSENDLLGIVGKIIHMYTHDSIELKTLILSGDIGTGKTTLFSRIMQNITTQNKPENPIYVLPINLDFENLIGTDDRQSKLLKDYVEFLSLRIEKLIKKNITDIKKTKEGKNKHIMPIIFFDNLDLVYQKFCEDYFITPFAIKFIDIFLSLIEDILRKEDKRILICGLRGESVRAIQDIKLGNQEKFDQITSLIMEVRKKTPSEIKSIIKKRLKLSYEGLKLINADPKELQIVEQNINNFDNTKIDFEELDSISSEGLRNTVDLFFRVSPTIVNSNIFNRFFVDEYYIKKMHFLGDSSVYTQAGNGIFNVFLNNTEFRYLEDSYKYDDSYISKHSSEHVRKLASISYLQTYWAKYFILLYLYQEKKKPKISPSSVEGLINVFSKHSTTERYEENLVRLILLGLSESRHGKIIDIILNNGDSLSRFSLSDRGKYILENHIWTFDYLSVVIDDIWLEFPDFLLEDFPFLQEVEESYCHESEQGIFQNERKIKLSQKIKKVKLFLEILKVSYIYEIKKVNTIIKILEEGSNQEHNFKLPNFNNIEQQIFSTMKKYAEICELPLKGELNLYTPILNKTQIKKLKKFFNKNYGLGLEYSQKDLLIYHAENIKEVSALILKHETTQPLKDTNNSTLFEQDK